MRGTSGAGRAGTMIGLRRRRGAFVGTPPRVNRLPACPRAGIESGLARGLAPARQMRRATGDDAASAGADLPPIDKYRIMPGRPMDRGAHQFAPRLRRVRGISEAFAVPRSRHRSGWDHAANGRAVQAERAAGRVFARRGVSWASRFEVHETVMRVLQGGWGRSRAGFDGVFGCEWPGLIRCNASRNCQRAIPSASLMVRVGLPARSQTIRFTHNLLSRPACRTHRAARNAAPATRHKRCNAACGSSTKARTGARPSPSCSAGSGNAADPPPPHHRVRPPE
jgi:hypothetical protein